MCPIDHHSSPPLSLFHPVPCRRSHEFGPNGIHYAFTDNLLNGAACRNPFIVTYSMVLGPPNGFFKGEILILDCHLDDNENSLELVFLFHNAEIESGHLDTDSVEPTISQKVGLFIVILHII